MSNFNDVYDIRINESGVVAGGPSGRGNVISRNVIRIRTKSNRYENECACTLCTCTFTDQLNSFLRFISLLKIKQLININDNKLNGKSVK